MTAPRARRVACHVGPGRAARPPDYLAPAPAVAETRKHATTRNPVAVAGTRRRAFCCVNVCACISLAVCVCVFTPSSFLKIIFTCTRKSPFDSKLG